MEKLPTISDEAQKAFESAAREMELDPNNKWIGKYVDYEWQHLRNILEEYNFTLEQANVLEFGCNVGASAIVFSILGANVWAIDVSRGMIQLAKLNALRYGVTNISFVYKEDTSCLPFEPNYFDIINCNSVLEYIPNKHLPNIQKELDRVLKVKGRILITGTSNRLWPKEVHSSYWFTNYIPHFFDSFHSKKIERGIFPWQARYGFGKNYSNIDHEDKGKSFTKSRLTFGANENKLRLLNAIAQLIGVGPGMILPNISCVLSKHGEQQIKQ